MLSAMPVLARGFLPLFDFEHPATETPAAAKVWASAYSAYAIAGGVGGISPGRIANLEADLTIAFNPESNGGGRSPFLTAMAKFWMGLAAPPGGIVVLFLPSGSIDSPQSDDATAEQQAQGLAQIIHGLTMVSVKVLVPPGPLPVPII